MDWVDVTADLEDIRDGRLRNADRIREVLAEARRMQEYEQERKRKLDSLIYRAQDAFLTGWPTRPENADSP